MPKFAPNTGFKMPGVGSKEIDSPSSFRDEHHVDKMGYCDNTPDDMLPEGSSPLKARYTTTGYRKDLDVIDAVNLSGTKPKEEPKPPSGGGGGGGNTKTPTPKKEGKKFDFNADRKINTDLSYDKSVTLKGSTPGKEKYSGGGTLKNQAEKDFYDKEVKRLGGVQQYRDHYKIGKKTTTPGSSSSISGNTKVKTNTERGPVRLGGFVDTFKKKNK